MIALFDGSSLAQSTWMVRELSHAVSKHYYWFFGVIAERLPDFFKTHQSAAIIGV